MLSPSAAQADHLQAEQTVPGLPVETSIVGAALSARDALQQAQVLSWLLANTPRDAGSVWSTIATLEQAVASARAHYAAYREIVTCKGSA